jgi:predicted ATPase
MRLDRLHIRSRFKNLADFQIDFDEASEMTVLVGRNGTGKSNLLEALTIIFRDLDLGLRPTFSYELCYFCRGHTITVDANPDRRGQLGYELTADGQRLTWRAFHDNPTREYLPNFVFGYYSGPGNRMERHFERHQEAFYRQLLNNNEQPLRPLFFARPVHSQFVLLAFFLDTDPAVATFLRDHLWIEDFDYALFIMREPPWTSRQGDPRFWNARGVVRNFLDRLYALALAPCRLKVRVPTEFKKQQSLEHLYLFLPDLEHVRTLAGHYDTQQAFFKALESTYISKLISEVRISVRARKVDGSLTFRELSEGEQQLLMVLGLLRFTREDESLFLLDEPDTHLNPAWSVQYLKFLREIGGAHENSHVIMATHDPMVISGLDRSQVQILQGKIPGDWFATAAQALADVTVITDPQKRAQAINERDDVWKALRERLAALRMDKCWYCESNDSRSDQPIDHYRPKNAIAECDTHGGYWWIAFSSDWPLMRPRPARWPGRRGRFTCPWPITAIIGSAWASVSRI